MDFGRVCVNSVTARSLSFTNDLTRSVLVQVRPRAGAGGGGCGLCGGVGNGGDSCCAPRHAGATPSRSRRLAMPRHAMPKPPPHLALLDAAPLFSLANPPPSQLGRLEKELSKSTPSAQVIPGGAVAGFDMYFTSPTEQSFKKTLQYTINEKHILKVTKSRARLGSTTTPGDESGGTLATSPLVTAVRGPHVPPGPPPLSHHRRHHAHSPHRPSPPTHSPTLPLSPSPTPAPFPFPSPPPTFALR